MIAVKKKILVIAAATAAVVIIVVTGIVLASMELTQEEINQFVYSLSVENETYNVTVEANWEVDNAPNVTLSNPADRHAIMLYFLGGSKKTITYNITVPTELLDGNISLVWKYYLQNPDRYILTNNGTHNSLWMTYDYDPHFSGRGYFEVWGTEGAW